MDKVNLHEMALRVAFKDPGRFPDVRIRRRRERRERVTQIPRRLMDHVRELGSLVKEKAIPKFSPELKRKLRELGELVKKYRDPEVSVPPAPQELIWRDPKRLEEVLESMSSEELKAVQRQTEKILAITGRPFWADRSI